jgi:hypothetical protein
MVSNFAEDGNRKRLTGVSGGEGKVGVGSSVDNAEAPVSPRNSTPMLLDFRSWRGMCVSFPTRHRISMINVGIKSEREKAYLFLFYLFAFLAFSSLFRVSRGLLISRG